MRLWSLHPRYLDGHGLVALWREGLLALAVVEDEAAGYRHHPQLVRFLRCRQPADAIRAYLRPIVAEAIARGYRFDGSKLGRTQGSRIRLQVTQGQLDYEWQHLLRKLHRRNRSRWARLRALQPSAHPLFEVGPGPIEAWERVRGPGAVARTSSKRRRPARRRSASMGRSHQ